VGRVLQRLVVLLAFVGVLLAPALSRAALLPTCEAYDPVTRMPVEWLPSLEATLEAEAEADACSAGVATAPDDVGDSKVAGMCDARGASVVAPQRVLAVGDARIEATPGCGVDISAPVIGPGPKHAPAVGAAPMLAENAVLDVASLVPPASSELGPPFLPPDGGPRFGVQRGVERPPRGL
jgi:hypothetical protein